MFVGQSPEEICFSPHLIYLAEVESQFTMCLLFGWVLVPREKVILRVCSNDKELKVQIKKGKREEKSKLL